MKIRQSFQQMVLSTGYPHVKKKKMNLDTDFISCAHKKENLTQNESQV